MSFASIGYWWADRSIHCLHLLYLLFATNLCAGSAGSQAEECKDLITGAVQLLEAKVPTDWSDFLMHMTGDSGDQDALGFLIESKTIDPVTAFLESALMAFLTVLDLRKYVSAIMAAWLP